MSISWKASDSTSMFVFMDKLSQNQNHCEQKSAMNCSGWKFVCLSAICQLASHLRSHFTIPNMNTASVRECIVFTKIIFFDTTWKLYPGCVEEYYFSIYTTNLMNVFKNVLFCYGNLTCICHSDVFTFLHHFSSAVVIYLSTYYFCY